MAFPVVKVLLRNAKYQSEQRVKLKAQCYEEAINPNFLFTAYKLCIVNMKNKKKYHDAKAVLWWSSYAASWLWVRGLLI